MSSSNGVVRIARKGMKKFAFGDDGEVFEVDVVAAMQHWWDTDSACRPDIPDVDGNRSIVDMPTYHQAARDFASSYGGVPVTTAEALDFIARLREQYDELAVFFRPKSREERGSPATSEGESSPTSASTEMRFSVEPG